MKKFIALFMASLFALSFTACSKPVESAKDVEPTPTAVVEQEPATEETEEFVVDPQLVERILDGYYGNGQARLDKLAEEGYSESEIEAIRAEVKRVYKERHPE